MQDHFEEVKASFARNQASAFGLLKQMVTELQTLANSNPEVGMRRICGFSLPSAGAVNFRHRSEFQSNVWLQP